MNKGRAIKKDNVVDFKQGPQFFYKLYSRSAESGNFYDAVFYLKKAAEAAPGDKSGEYLAELARTYSSLSRYGQSSAVYLKLLSEGREEAKSYFGLSQNLYYMGDVEHSVHYLNLYMDKYGQQLPFIDEEDEEYIEIATEEDEIAGYRIVYPPQRRDETELLAAAKDYMKSGLFQKAADLLITVDKDNPDYLYARNNLALCCFFLNDYKLTRQYSEEVLAADPGNVYALCNLAAMYGYTGDSAQTAHYVAQILQSKSTELSDLFKISTTFCELKLHDKALEYLLLILKQKPYDYNVMFLTAIAYYNNKQSQKAAELFLQLLRLDGDDYAVKYYIDYIETVQVEGDSEKGIFQPLEYICQLPYGEMLERLRLIKDALKLTRAQAAKLRGRQLLELLDMCDWSFGVTDVRFQTVMVRALMSRYRGADVIRLLREKLLSAETGLNVKKLIVELFVLHRIPPAYVINADYVLKTLSPITETPEKQFKPYYAGYAQAYAYSAVSRADGTEHDLFRAYKELCIAADGQKPPAQSVIAAVIFYISKGLPSQKLRQSACSIFRVRPSAFEKTLERFNLE